MEGLEEPLKAKKRRESRQGKMNIQWKIFPSPQMRTRACTAIWRVCWFSWLHIQLIVHNFTFLRGVLPNNQSLSTFFFFVWSFHWRIYELSYFNTVIYLIVVIKIKNLHSKIFRISFLTSVSEFFTSPPHAEWLCRRHSLASNESWKYNSN